MSNVKQKLKALEARRQGMEVDFNQVKPIFEEIREHMLPTRGRFSVGENRRSSHYNKKIIDTKAQKAQKVLTSGLMAGMTSPSRPWFKLGVYDSGAQEDFEVKQWLNVVEDRMYDVIRGSNTYRMLKQCYSDLSTYGVFCGLMVGDFENVVHTHSFPVGMYRLGQDEKGIVNSLHYSCEKTVAQVVQQFGLENVSDRTYRAYKANNLHEKVHINHAVEQRLDRDPMSALAKDMPMASFYWENGETEKFLQEGGYGANNILAPRWDGIDNEVWPTDWPALMALGDSVQLQAQIRSKATAIEKSHNPPMVAPAGFNSRYRGIPGGITTASTADLQKGGIRPALEVRPDVSALIHDINETRDRIGGAFFEDLFLMTSMSDRRQVTATEIAERHEEKLTVLGPVLESLDYELLSKVIDVTFHHMIKADIIPEAPDALQGMPIKVEYVSMLAQAQKAIGIGAIERTLGFAGSLSQIDPKILDNLNSDQMFRNFVDQVGSPDMMNSPNQVKELRESRAAQEQQQQAMEAVPQMAQAAKLISEAGQRGAETLQRGAAL